MDLGLTGKVAVITGASEGIGLATATAFAREDVRVAICARRQDVLAEAAQSIRDAVPGADVLDVPTDMTSGAEVDAFMQAVQGRFGGIDILINNVGQSAAGPFESVTDEAWQYDIDLKLLSTIRTCRVAVPSMRTRGGGRIVNITTVAGKAPGAASYPSSVTRAAGIALTKGLSKELAPDNILVNTICLSIVESGQITRNAQRRFPDLPLDQAFAEMGKGLPVGRIGKADEAADLIVYLCSARAGFITGASINFDGGASPVV
jgi:NAD(P)-dependent dehydrogenase (short-subunit alcohol dehydrogenase family)